MTTRRQQPRRRFAPLKALRLLLPVMLFIVMCVIMCSPESITAPEDAAEPEGLFSEAQELPKPPPPSSGKYKNVFDLERDTVSYYKRCLPEMPGGTVRMKVNYFGDPRKAFNDSNYIHWQAAERIGITPLTDTRSHWRLKRPIVKVTTNQDFYLDTLVYSRPYLVPLASARLHEIGRRFRDTLEARGGGDYRIKVTSVLRTPSTVKRLRRVNRNAVDSSVHQLGTTFDISYASFIADSPTPARSVDDLKGVLSEVLRAMKNEGKLLIKFEVHQPCFHITACDNAPEGDI